MNKYYITFGQNHVHKFENTILDNDCVAVITAPDENEARRLVQTLFKKDFSMFYTSLPKMEFYPRGLIHI